MLIEKGAVSFLGMHTSENYSKSWEPKFFKQKVKRIKTTMGE